MINLSDLTRSICSGVGFPTADTIGRTVDKNSTYGVPAKAAKIDGTFAWSCCLFVIFNLIADDVNTLSSMKILELIILFLCSSLSSVADEDDANVDANVDVDVNDEVEDDEDETDICDKGKANPSCSFPSIWISRVWNRKTREMKNR